VRDEWRLGPELKRRRTKADLSQREAAARAGISESKWRQLESGHVSMGAGQRVRVGTRPDTAVAAGRAVGLSAEAALELAGYDPAEHPELVNAADDPADDTVPGFSRLSPRQRQKVVELVQAILETDEEPTGVRPGVAPPDIARRGTVLGRRDDRDTDSSNGRANA